MRLFICLTLVAPGPWSVVIHQDAVSGAFQVLELAMPQGPPEEDPNYEYEYYRERNKQIQNVHCVPYLRYLRRDWSLSALSTTSSELADMPIPASHGVTQPTMANGIAMIL